MESNFLKSLFRLFLTVKLGLIFSYFQYLEYNESFFSINDSVYGSIFYILTGFHGFHVIVGTIFNLIILIRLINKHLSLYHFFGFEASS
ncbi:GSCOCG00012524001-RA-CDS [Cotesia congregata]|nr:GSCOCG00012524001-RA-CDS [Cotesia congregata]